MHSVKQSQQGYLAILAIILIVVIGFIGTAISTMYFGTSLTAANDYQADSALYLAESGIEHGTHALLQPTVANRTACSSLNIGPLYFGNGAYTVSATNASHFVSAPTQLSASITASATNIPVASTSGYQSTGRIMIDGEFMDYASLSSTSFNNVIRGVDGSIANTHTSGTAIGQYQCNVKANAGVPNLTRINAQRTLTGNIQLQFGLLGGDLAGSNITLAAWNYGVETTWNNLSSNISNNISLNGSTLLSTVDGWLVGTAGTFLHWNGTNVTAFTSNTGSTVTLNAVHCLAANNCHAVGNKESSNINAIFDWVGGSQWQEVNLSNVALNKNTNLMAIHCDSSNDCWAVGSNKKFFHYDGSGWTGYKQTLTVASYFGVFCNASNDCWAVGNNNTFARLTAGTTWTSYTTTLPTGRYNAIYCNTSNDCWAVGNASGTQDVFAHWDGSAWTQDLSNPSPSSDLTAVQCQNTNDCWSVGYTKTGNNPVVVHWDGSAWTNFTSMANGALPTGTPLRTIALVGPNREPISNDTELIT